MAINGWDVVFGDRGVTFSGGVTTDDYEWKRPSTMTTEEKEHFGVKRVPKSELDSFQQQAVSTNDTYVYVAENPPVNVEPISSEDKEEIRKEKRKRLKKLE